MDGTNISAIYRIVKEEFAKHHMPVVDLIEVETRDPFKVLVGTILSARTKDETTAAASARLFKVAGTPDELRRVALKKLQRLIFPVGFYQNKARFLKQLPDVLDAEFGGRLPQTVEELVKLPGVGRKTANLVVAVGFNKPAVCVDVHVHRIMNRLAYVKTETPVETEMALRKKLPKKYWTTFNSYFVSFGQHTCFPRNPRCDRCPAYGYCRRVGVRTKYGRSHASGRG
jgi:endonuclease III